ncbi:hypothetical protein Tco_0131885, partial [Tanacetum coccineum]
FHALWYYNIDKTCCGGEACHLDEQNPRCLKEWENLDFQDLVVDGWVNGNGLNPGDGFRKSGGGRETRGAGNGLEGPGGGATWDGFRDSLGDDEEV